MKIKLKAFFALAGIAIALIPQAEAQNTNRAVVAWGRYWNGSASVPATVPDGLNGIVAIAAGGNHSVALKSDGVVVAWGYIYDGSAWVPATVPGGLNGVIAISAGLAHSVALKSNGTVVAWGYNVDGRSTVPGGLNGVVAIAAGGGHSLALKSDGTMVAWGDNWVGQSTVPVGLNGVVAIAAGWGWSLALIASPPALVVQASGANVLLSWPLSAPGFALQSTTNLMDVNSWTPVAAMPLAESSRNRVTDSISGPAKFYRLKK